MKVVIIWVVKVCFGGICGGVSYEWRLLLIIISFYFEVVGNFEIVGKVYSVSVGDIVEWFEVVYG